MKFYWTAKSFPELRGLNPAQRKAVWRACFLRPFSHWQTWVAFIGQIPFAIVGGALGAYLDGWHHFWLAVWFGGTVEPKQIEGLGLPIYHAILFWAGGMVGGMIFWQVYSRTIRGYLGYLEPHNFRK